MDLSRCFSLHLLASGSDGSPPRWHPKRRRPDLALHPKRNASERIFRLLFTCRTSTRMFPASHWPSRTMERVLNLERYRSAGSMHFLRVGANSIASESDPAYGQYKAQDTHNLSALSCVRTSSARALGFHHVGPICKVYPARQEWLTSICSYRTSLTTSDADSF